MALVALAALGVGMILAALNVSYVISVTCPLSRPVLAFCHPGHLPGESGAGPVALADQPQSHGRTHYGHPFLAAEPAGFLVRYLALRYNQRWIVCDRHCLFQKMERRFADII